MMKGERLKSKLRLLKSWQISPCRTPNFIFKLKKRDKKQKPRLEGSEKRFNIIKIQIIGSGRSRGLERS